MTASSYNAHHGRDHEREHPQPQET
jgi:hypothetical protein